MKISIDYIVPVDQIVHIMLSKVLIKLILFIWFACKKDTDKNDNNKNIITTKWFWWEKLFALKNIYYELLQHNKALYF